ncbi:Molybdenum cofactor guanylyltransferase [Tepidimonas sediminis]|uniref:Molybdenum cofactor guanylyltransferase n=1 Tax=Tepidimonas sediminis TaxID=2588941 RepID=A0A554WUP8_9BURK|nr:molybdenum cofactor guanylyltransferase MobA [Tepidimonas sediminis]TSE27294.1 Molybdenum cofactor guanylyltransferase [Tepidimonas sediminis]
MTAATPHPDWSAPTPGGVTGLVLAGGRGSRMGGLDKGLQTFRGAPLALHALLRLQQQRGGWVGPCLINANRHLAAYEALGAPVWPDVVEGYAGPLAGMLTGLIHATTPWVLSVPCDSPLLPLDLAERLVAALTAAQADVALAAAREDDGVLRAQPVFALLGAHLLDDLQTFLRDGGRKIDAWTARQRCVVVPFDQPGDDPLAFANVNTLHELHALDAAGAVPPNRR